MRADDALYELDRATRAIAGELDLDRVLQLIVDGVRDLVRARYAALGIVDEHGRIERFITSGISDEERARIGPLPQGHGLLGTIIRDGAPLRIPDIAKHPDSYGFPPEHPPMTSLLGVPISAGGETIGNFYLTDKVGATEFSDDDQELVELFARHAVIAITNARLHYQVQSLAVVDERLRISRDLHDGIIQSIYAVTLSLEDVPDLLDEDREEAVARVDRAIDRLNTTIGDIRTFIVGLDSAAGSDNLETGLDQLARELASQSGIDVEIDLAGARAMEGSVGPGGTHELLQVAREALSNVARHSEAHRAGVSVRVVDGTAVLCVEDDGRGFDPTRRMGPAHFGLANLRDRAAALGGVLDIASSPGEGTRIMLTLPVLETEALP